MKKTTKKTTKKTAKTVLVLRTCFADMTSYGGFKRPKRGPVSAPDWVDNYKCGNGLHGWLWGEGDGLLGRTEKANAKWLVVRVLASEVRHGSGDMIGKCKFPRGFEIVGETLLYVTDDGSEDLGDHEWDQNSFCRCPECEWQGTVGEAIGL